MSVTDVFGMKETNVPSSLQKVKLASWNIKKKLPKLCIIIKQI